MNVIALPEVQQSLQSLKNILFEQEYFGFEESSQKYVDDMFDDILLTLPIRTHRPAPAYFNKYGKGLYYAVFPKNKQTQWYAFFKIYRENGELYYQVCHIANNHTVAQYLI